jgi:hypothetical protein
MNSVGNNTLNTNGNNSNKKHPQNTSLFRRLSERKVARDIEAAAAAGVSLPVPTSCINTNTVNNPMTTTIATTTTTTTNTDALSSSLPLLSFNQLTLDPSEWPPLKSPILPSGESDSPKPTSLPSIVKQKSQSSVKCDQAVHQSLCKTTSEPPRFSRQNSTPTTQNQYPVNSDTNEQNDQL